MHLYKKKKYLKAIEQLDKVLLRLEGIETDKHECLYLKGICLISLNRTEEALDCFNYSIKLNQKYFQAEFAKGCILKKQKKYVESFECFKRAIKKDSTRLEDCEVYLQIAKIFIDQKKFNEGISFFNHEIQVHPYDYLLYLAKGILYKNQKNFIEASKCFRKAINVNNDDTNELTYSLLASILTEDEKYEGTYKAKSYLNKALKLNKKNIYAHYYKAIMHFRLKQYHESLKCFKKVIHLNDFASKNALFPLGHLEYNLDMSLVSLFSMGHIFFMIKKPKKAFYCYNKAMNLSSELKHLLKPTMPIMRLMSKKCMKEALIICNHTQDSKENTNNFLIYYLKAIILNNLNNEQSGFFHFNYGRQMQKSYDYNIDPESILFHSFFYVYDQSLMTSIQKSLKKNKIKWKKEKKLID